MNAYEIKMASCMAIMRLTKFVFNQHELVSSFMDLAKRRYGDTGRGVLTLIFNSPRQIQDAVNDIERGIMALPLNYISRADILESEPDVTRGEIDQYDPQTSFLAAILVENPGAGGFTQVVHCCADAYYLITPTGAKHKVEIDTQRDPQFTTECVKL